jgi:hypothetical protein
LNVSTFEKYVLGVCHDIDELIYPNRAEIVERFAEFAARNFEGLFEKHPKPGQVIAGLFNEWKTRGEQMKTEHERSESRLKERIRYLEDRYDQTVRDYETRGEQMQTAYERRESHLNERLRYLEDRYDQTVRDYDAKTRKSPQETTTGDLWMDGLNLWADDATGASKLFEAYVLSYPENKSKPPGGIGLVSYFLLPLSNKTHHWAGLSFPAL